MNSMDLLSFSALRISWMLSTTLASCLGRTEVHYDVRSTVMDKAISSTCCR